MAKYVRAPAKLPAHIARGASRPSLVTQGPATPGGGNLSKPNVRIVPLKPTGPQVATVFPVNSGSFATGRAAIQQAKSAAQARQAAASPAVARVLQRHSAKSKALAQKATLVRDIRRNPPPPTANLRVGRRQWTSAFFQSKQRIPFQASANLGRTWSPG